MDLEYTAAAPKVEVLPGIYLGDEIWFKTEFIRYQLIPNDQTCAEPDEWHKLIINKAQRSDYQYVLQSKARHIFDGNPEVELNFSREQIAKAYAGKFILNQYDFDRMRNSERTLREIEQLKALVI